MGRSLGRGRTSDILASGCCQTATDFEFPGWREETLWEGEGWVGELLSANFSPEGKSRTNKQLFSYPTDVISDTSSTPFIFWSSGLHFFRSLRS
jgi:hypothetical protein